MQFQLPKSLAVRLKVHAAKTSRTMSDIVAEAVRKSLKDEK